MTEDISRQSFLGPDSDRIFASCKIGIIGASGGGSHIAQQTAHIGVLNHVIVDLKNMAQKHLHRLVGATAKDVEDKTPKAKIAERTIKSIRPTAKVNALVGNWQENQRALRDCTVIFGCVDGYSEREQLDRFCRRFLIPYIDIGMDVLKFDESSRIVGQVVLSTFGHPCLRCMAVITEDNLRDEAANYGSAGARPQVIWPNAVLAASAVGLFVQLVTPWHQLSSASAYLEYNGNTPLLTPSPRMEYAVNQPCTHFSAKDIGDPFFNLEEWQRFRRDAAGSSRGIFHAFVARLFHRSKMHLV
jgi:molybdopterin-synthase adenylyltransferase